jgi:hypothetical protein
MRGFLKQHPRVFNPDEVHILFAAFDKAWETVQASGMRYPEAETEQVRAILAKHIIEVAKDGERDQRRLRDGALPRLGSIKFAKRAASAGMSRYTSAIP